MTEETPAPVEAVPAAVEVPDWLQEAAPSVAEETPSPVEPVPAPVEVPDWLQEAAPSVAEETPSPVEPVPALVEVPDWLQEAVPGVAEETPPVSPLVGVSSSQVSEVPDWLTELEPEPALSSGSTAPVFEGPLPPEPEIEAAQTAGLVRAEVPSWLEDMRLHGEAGAAAVEEPEETEGLLEGLRGVLPLASVIEMPAARERALPAQASEVSLTRAQLFQSLLSRPPQTPQPETLKASVSVSEWLQRFVVGLVLLLSVLAILAWQPLMDNEAPLLTRPGQLEEAGKDLYNTIESVNAEEHVLIAFEYGPSEADELDIVAQSILRHLVCRGATISIVSTRPEGLTIGTRVWNETWEEVSLSAAPEEEFGQYYEPDTHYRPGDATGVSQLLANAEAITDTHSSLILVLTAQPAPLRWWIEQAQARGKTVVAGVSAAAEIAASPYLDASTGQLSGAISGLRGAAAYENYRGIDDGQSAKRLNALAAGHAAVVVLMFVGAVIYTFVRPRREKR
ncbi:MAG: hypothetical protein DRI77_02615 [Chloroflexi bacterium]|nr:MAG: hypothetical protein DRI77_02615 [Chloroflexota bacterium]